MRSARQKRLKLWRENPHCHWCGVLTILPETDSRGKIVNRPKGWNTIATLDHLRARHHPGRHEPCGPGERRIVLACYRCNNIRDRSDVRAHWTEQQIRDTGREPNTARLRLPRAMLYAPKWLYESPSRELNSAPSAPKADVAPRDSTAEAQKIA